MCQLNPVGAVEYKCLYRVLCGQKEVLAVVAGKMMHQAAGRQDYPAVGDWVVIDRVRSEDDRAVIRGILARKSKFSRKCAGNTLEEQILAVNIDTIFICMSLNRNFNLRRLERYITMAWESGAYPVVLLTKSDLCEDVDKRLAEAREVAIGVEVYPVSSLSKCGINGIKRYIKRGSTVAFLGSSGVGKSTLINELLGENRLATQEVSSIGDKGKHTTTNRELIVLPEGGIVIDTPGMREFHILDAEEGIETAFNDIEQLSRSCKFSDCTHTVEPHCAVIAAIDNGTLSEERYNSYVKLKKEAEFMVRKTDKRAASEYKKHIKKLMSSVRNR